MQQPYVLMPVMPQMRPPPMQMPQTQEMGGMTIQMGMMQSAFGMNPYPPPHEYGDDGEPASKRQKAEDNYVAEYDWMKMHNVSVVKCLHSLCFWFLGYDQYCGSVTGD